MALKALPKYDTAFEALPGWITVEEAAHILDRTGARVRQMIEARNFKRVAIVGDRPLYLLRRNEVKRMAQRTDRPTRSGS